MTQLQKLVQDCAFEIRKIVAEAEADHPRLFGTILREEDGSASGVDILVDAGPHFGLLSLAVLTARLEDLLGTQVRVLTTESIYPSLREAVISEARPL